MQSTRTAADYNAMTEESPGVEYAWQPVHAGDHSTILARKRAMDSGRLRVIAKEDRPKSLEELDREQAEADQDLENLRRAIKESEDRAARVQAEREEERRAAAPEGEEVPILEEPNQPFAGASVGHRTVPYAELALLAFERSGLDATAWNALPPAARIGRVKENLELLRLEAAQAAAGNPSSSATLQDLGSIGREGAPDDAPVPQGDPVQTEVHQAPKGHPNEILGTELLSGQEKVLLESGREVTPAEIVADAFMHSGLTRERWNELPATDRAAMLSWSCIRQGYADQVAKGQANTGTEEEAAQKGLLGSSSLPSTVVIDGQPFQLGEIVAGAHARSGLSAVAWNATPEQTLDVVLRLEVERLQKLAEEAKAPANPAT